MSEDRNQVPPTDQLIFFLTAESPPPQEICISWSEGEPSRSESLQGTMIYTGIFVSSFARVCPCLRLCLFMCVYVNVSVSASVCVNV